MIMNELAAFLLRTKAIDDLPLIVSIVASILLTATKSGEKQRNVVLITLTGILCVACFGISAITIHYNNEYSLVPDIYGMTYKFVGYLELPSLARQHNYREETRKGVAVEYVPNALPA